MQVSSIRDLAVAARARRLDLGLSQAEVAARARVSRQWVSEFEAGKPAAEIGLVLRLLHALDLRLDLLAGDGARGSPAMGSPFDLDSLLEEYQSG